MRLICFFFSSRRRHTRFLPVSWGSEMCIRDSRRPSRNLRIAGISEISSAPFANTALPPPACDDTSSGTATASLTAYLGDADHRPSSLAPPPLTGPKPPVTLQLSSTAQTQMTFPIPVHRHPGALPSADTAFFLPTLVHHHGLPSSRVVFVFVCIYFVLFFLSVKRFYSPTECSTASGHRTGPFPIPNPIPVPEGASVTPL